MEPQVKVRGRKQTRDTKKERLKRSAFFITVNTNQQYNPGDKFKKSDMDVFEEVMQEMGDNLPKFVKILDQDRKWNTDDIPGRVEFDYVSEFGSKKNSLHGHILVKIEHRTRVHMNIEAIREHFKKELGLKNLYVDCRLVQWPDSESFLLDYIEKMTS